ncbi:MAG: Uma2 family endonuclease [Hyphomicrobium sp.]
MNEISRPPRSQHATTQAAEGLPRLAWSLAEFERLSELGFFGGVDRERERLELIDGELVPMNAKGARHEWVRGELNHYLSSRLPGGLRLYPEPGWRPGGELYLEPEFLICRAGLQPSSVPPGEVLLLIEVADTSLRYDTATKGKIYAQLGVREYWVVNALTLETIVHLEPGEQGYGNISILPPGETLAPVALPALTVSLGALKLG